MIFQLTLKRKTESYDSVFVIAVFFGNYISGEFITALSGEGFWLPQLPQKL